MPAGSLPASHRRMLAASTAAFHQPEGRAHHRVAPRVPHPARDLPALRDHPVHPAPPFAAAADTE